MKYSLLGSSQLNVSRVCLGTMTWGTQNDQRDADQQIDYALSRGVNLIDTAEMYSIPPTSESYGKTESIIGNWLARNTAKRSDIILMSKIAGPGLSWAREGAGLSGDGVVSAIEESLQRLNADYLDVYQLHWPNRRNPHFGRHNVNVLPFTEADAGRETDNMHEVLRALAECVAQGKLRFVGISNDTPWGLSQFLRMSQEEGLPRVTSVQNEFSLLHTKDWPYFFEQCAMEDVAYLPWSPLAGGMLSGKYLDGALPEGSRWTYQQRNGLFRNTDPANEAIRAYQMIAAQQGMTLAQLALKWVDQVDGVTSTIIGATSMQQLTENIDAFDKVLDETAIGDIEKIRRQYPVPF